MAEQQKNRPPWLRYSGVGIEYAAAVGGFAAVGYWIDVKYGCSPWGVIIGAALGLIGGTYNLIRETTAAFRPPGQKRDRNDRHLPGTHDPGP
jgi:F0F1-type ATP synthase assembly protein I